MARHRSLRRLAPALIAVLAAALAGACGGDDASDGAASATTAAAGSSDGQAAFPVTIEHAFGQTVIDRAPTRVVTVGWGSADAAIALGVVPVAIPFQSYGGNEQGLLPWIAEELQRQGVATPTILPDAPDAPPIEAIAAARPDLILAPYSGITAEQYGLLAKIAPTVAYPGEAWATPWRDTIRIVGKALGREPQAEQLLADIAERIATAAKAHPEMQGKSVAMVWDSGGKFYVYKPADARVEFTEDLGLMSAPSVTALANGDQTFYYTLSYEQLGALTSDVLVSYADTEAASKAFLGASYAQLMAQVQKGAVAEVTGTEFIASVSPPTALSLTWGLDDYVKLLSDAAKQASGTS